MNNLTPKQLVDRNGVLTTRRVRIDAKKTPFSAVPAPAKPASSERPPLDLNPGISAEPKKWRTPIVKMDAAQDLKDACVEYNTTGTFHASDAEAYNVLSVVAPHNVLPLLSAGFTTPSSAIDFLNSKGLSRLIQDNRLLAQSALDREMPSDGLLQFCAERTESARERPTFLDAAEAWRSSSLRLAGNGVVNMVLQGDISIDDIKAVGAKHVASWESQSEVMNTLKAIQRGDSTIDVKTLAALTKKFDPDASEPTAEGSRLRDMAIVLTKRYGAEYALRLKNHRAVGLVYRFVGNTDNDLTRELLPYADELHSQLSTPDEYGSLTVNEFIDLYEAGVSTGLAAKGLASRMEVDQIIDAYKQGINSNVAEGWL